MRIKYSGRESLDWSKNAMNLPARTRSERTTTHLRPLVSLRLTPRESAPGPTKTSKKLALLSPFPLSHRHHLLRCLLPTSLLRLAFFLLEDTIHLQIFPHLRQLTISSHSRQQMRQLVLWTAKIPSAPIVASCAVQMHLVCAEKSLSSGQPVSPTTRSTSLLSKVRASTSNHSYHWINPCTSTPLHLPI